jgi:predicted enzyme related to lactoylglutathione lyase
MKIRRIVPDITSSDFGASQKFYTSVLGLQLAMNLEWVMTFVSPDNPTAQITIIQKDQTAPTNPHISIEVEDVIAVFSNAQAAGADIIYPLTEEPWGVRRFFVRDPNGVIINVLSQD